MKRIRGRSLIVDLFMVLMLSLASFTLFFSIFGSMLISRSVQSTRQVQAKWMESYSKTFLDDLRLGRSLNVERRLTQLVSDGIFEDVTLRFSDQTIRASGDSSSRASKPSLLERLFSKALDLDEATKLSLPVKDEYGSTWAEIDCKISPKIAVRPLQKDLLHFFLCYVALNLFAIALAVYLFGAVEESLLELRNMILSRSHKQRAEMQKNEIEAIRTAFVDYEQQILESEKQLMAQSKAMAVAELSAQVAHDIRSPLAAVSMIEKDMSLLPEDTRLLLRNAISRIHDIAAQLLSKHAIRPANENLEKADEPVPHLITSLIAALVSEKRLQFRSKMNIEIDMASPSDYGIFAKVQPRELQRILSNLINNSVEALKSERGKILITTKKAGSNVEISVRDNGGGIPPELLGRLGNLGETHGKSDGSGMGLYHAKKNIEQWGGSLRIVSKLGLGTTVTVSLPRVAPPKWFVSALHLIPGSVVVVVDDDSSIHQIWKSRFESLTHLGLEVLHFVSPEAFREWLGSAESASQACLYLIDYEFLGCAETGTMLIETLGIADNSILVTSRYEDTSIREKCDELGVSLIPKGMAALVPISFPTTASSGAHRDAESFH